ncbi:hypothetical protein [Sutterella wadsworthensis]|uniref:hypothetical protein n=1 Tax=Sutterella wadsworthensis TaxID=40545 RepID=UPI0026DB9B9B|nr:hypothetical protein [Sutterella wadsworthensis]
MMDRKPWQDKGLRRSFDGDEGGERRRFGRFDRFDREERSDRREFDDRPRRDFGDRKPFGDRPRFDRFDRSDRSDRFDRSERRDFGDRPRRDFGDRPRFDNKKPFRNRFDGPRQDFGTRSGPRARAYDTRRFAERSEFARNAMVKIDSDIADFFGSPEAVNQALRLLIDAARTVKFPQAAAETPNAELEPATAAQIFGETDIDDDDVEDSEYGDGAADSADDADMEGCDEVSVEEDKADK